MNHIRVAWLPRCQDGCVYSDRKNHKPSYVMHDQFRSPNDFAIVNSSVRSGNG